MMNTMTRTLARRHMASPIGTIHVIADERALVAILWDTDSPLSEGAAHNPVEQVLGDTPIVDVGEGEHAVLDAAIAQLGEYFAGQRTEFDLPLAPDGTPFQRQAWMALRTIPFGRTISYGQQAAALGDPRKARAVGAANGRNPIPIVVPCHRVVGSSGNLTGFAGGLGVKAWLLAHERKVTGETLI
jgi:methylated-DNA-[protein]-cysteine S-methyltransferase